MSNPEDAQRNDARREFEEALDELSAAATLGIARVPESQPQGAEEEQASDQHTHMHRFPIFVVNEEGEVVEMDPREVPRYKCDEEGCEDATHDHSGGAHQQEHVEDVANEHSEKGKEERAKKPRPKRNRS